MHPITTFSEAVASLVPCRLRARQLMAASWAGMLTGGFSMWARSIRLTWPVSAPGNASSELLVLGQRTHRPFVSRKTEGKEKEGKRNSKRKQNLFSKNKTWDKLNGRKGEWKIGMRKRNVSNQFHTSWVRRCPHSIQYHWTASEGKDANHIFQHNYNPVRQTEGQHLLQPSPGIPRSTNNWSSIQPTRALNHLTNTHHQLTNKHQYLPTKKWGTAYQ